MLGAIDSGLTIKDTEGVSPVHFSWSYIAWLGAYLTFIQKLCRQIVVPFMQLACRP